MVLHIDVVDVYEGANTTIRSPIGNKQSWITPKVCFEPYIFALVVDELTRYIEDDIS